MPMTESLQEFFGAHVLWLLPLLIVDGVLRGMALWKSARKRQLSWFVALMILNTMGIFPAIYLLIVEPNQKTKK